MLETKFSQMLKAKADEKMASQDATIDWAKKYVPEYIFRGMCPLHEELAKIADDLRKKRGEKVLVVAPRGNAKSTWCSFVTPLKAVCEKTEKYILLVADTADQARKYLASIKTELESNEELRAKYPLACKIGEVWNQDRIETTNDVCVEVIGKGAKARGRKFGRYRPTLIIVDDPQGDEDVQSPVTMQKDLEWYNKALIPAGDKETNYFIVGTMLHRECIVGNLVKRPNLRKVYFKAIIEWPTRMDLWDEWERLYHFNEEECTDFYEANRVEMHEGAKVLWEDKENLLDLMTLRADIGHAAFQSEKQNDPRDPSKCEFKEEWLSDDNLELFYKTKPKNLPYIRVGYADPAMGGDTKKHDDFAIINIDYFPSLRKCYVEADLDKLPVNLGVDKMIMYHKIDKFEAFGLEVNGFQELLLPDLESKAPFFPVVPMENRINKLARISRLGIWLQRGFFVFKSGCKSTRKLLDQLRDHPHAAHDDGSDALEGALRVLSTVVEFDDSGDANTDFQDDGLGDNIFGDS